MSGQEARGEAEHGRPFLLDATSLVSKWGFGDGDALGDWWWDVYDESARINTDDLLYALVIAYLMPAIRAAGHDGELERIETSHNPVRLATLDGQEVDQYDSSREPFDPPIWVDVTQAQIEEMYMNLSPGAERPQRRPYWFGDA